MLVALAFWAAAQSTLPPGMAYVPNTLLNYDYWRDRDKNTIVSAHFASKYIESNYQYQWYLRYLKAWGLEKHWQFAQPNPSVWELPNLTFDEQAYLKEYYWTTVEFEHYPVVGLDVEQIRAYLHWKTCMMNLAAYEAAGGTEDFIYNGNDSTAVRSAEGFPKLFSINEYLFRTTDTTRIFEPFAAVRLPIAHELMAELPLPKKIKKGTAKPDKSLMAWLKTQPKFGFLAYEPPKPKGRPTELQKVLESLGVRPVVASDLKQLKKQRDEANLPLVCWQEPLDEKLYKEGFIYVCSEDELKTKQLDPKFNPKNLQVIMFDPKKAGTVSWISDKGKLVTMSISTIEKRPLCGFRGVMTKGK